MNKYITCAALLGCALAGSPVLADDAMQHVTMTNHQLLQECIEKQKTLDVAQSKAAMKKFCKAQLKQQKETGALPEPPPQDSPHN
jgi:hypothetical protein